MTLTIQNPAFLAQMVKEGFAHGVDNLGHLVWTQALLQCQLMGIQNPISTSEINTLMFQSLQNFPFFPNLPTTDPSMKLTFVPWNPVSPPTQVNQTHGTRRKRQSEANIRVAERNKRRARNALSIIRRSKGTNNHIGKISLQGVQRFGKENGPNHLPQGPHTLLYETQE